MMFVDARGPVTIDVDELGHEIGRRLRHLAFDMCVDVRSECFEQARGDDLLLSGERTASAVGDLRDTRLQLIERVRRGVASRRRVEQLRDPQPVEFAR